jgi:GNAT superfamily N-acetyltransferase/RimJ/RimL family protein N-acetyltransferase
VELCWLDPEHLSDRDVGAALAVLEGAREVDSPQELGRTLGTFAAELRFGWDGEPFETAILQGPHGQTAGVLQVGLPRWDNTHTAFLEVTVDPVYRHEGLGTALFAAGLERARNAGRTLLLAASWDRHPGTDFAKAMGLHRGSDEVKRALDLTGLDRHRLAALAERAAPFGEDYEILPMPVPTPSGQLAELAMLSEAINDAPTDDLDVEDEVFSPERIRSFENAQSARSRRLYRLVARCRSTGALAGHTLVAVDQQRPWRAHQLDTSVLRAHRGHRLGLALKTAMLITLKAAEPQLRCIDTWNAASNAHMIGINEALGFEVVGSAIEWQSHLEPTSDKPGSAGNET